MLKNDFSRVLFVDDEDCIRELAGEVFPKAGYDIVLAGNGVDALNKIRDAVFDVVVTDIMMPKLNGIDLYYGAIDETPQLENKFIFTTGLPSLKTVSFLSQNSCPHHYKPYRMDDLMKSVEGLMAVKRGNSEKRFARRFDLVTEGLLTDGVFNKHSPLIVETQNISKSGVRLKYSGEPLVKDVKVELNLRAMDVKRSARVIWSLSADDSSFSGLAFA